MTLAAAVAIAAPMVLAARATRVVSAMASVMPAAGLLSWAVEMTESTFGTGPTLLTSSWCGMGTDRDGNRVAARNWAAKAALATWHLRTARCMLATALAHLR